MAPRQFLYIFQSSFIIQFFYLYNFILRYDEKLRDHHSVTGVLSIPTSKIIILGTQNNTLQVQNEILTQNQSYAKGFSFK